MLVVETTVRIRIERKLGGQFWPPIPGEGSKLHAETQACVRIVQGTTTLPDFWTVWLQWFLIQGCVVSLSSPQRSFACEFVHRGPR